MRDTNSMCGVRVSTLVSQGYQKPPTRKGDGIFFGEGSKNVSASGASGKDFAKKTLSGFEETGFFEEKFHSRGGGGRKSLPHPKGRGSSLIWGRVAKKCFDSHVSMRT